MYDLKACWKVKQNLESITKDLQGSVPWRLPWSNMIHNDRHEFFLPLLIKQTTPGTIKKLPLLIKQTIRTFIKNIFLPLLIKQTTPDIIKILPLLIKQTTVIIIEIE